MAIQPSSLSLVGAAIGPLQAGYIFDISSSYRVAFLVCGVTAVSGIAFTVLLKPVERWPRRGTEFVWKEETDRGV